VFVGVSASGDSLPVRQRPTGLISPSKVAAMSTPGRIVSVEFVDADTGYVIGRSDLPVGQLPESFDPDTTVQLGEDSWVVERADPVTAAEFVTAGRLTLTLRRLVQVPLSEILYSLPTICSVLPAVGRPGGSGERLELLEDDWRQVELVSRSLLAEVETEFSAIRRIYEEHAHRDPEGRVFAFDKIHVRSIVSLAESLPWSRLRTLLPASQPPYEGVGFRGHPDIAVGSFVRPDDGGWWWYGLRDEDLVSVLGLHIGSDRGPLPVASVEPILRAFDLMVVDWCQCAAVDADGLANYPLEPGR